MVGLSPGSGDLCASALGGWVVLELVGREVMVNFFKTRGFTWVGRGITDGRINNGFAGDG